MSDVERARWHVLPDAETVAGEATARILMAAEAAVAARGRFRMVLAGGSTPARAYALLAGADADWDAWEIFHGDERCLPAAHPDRNSVMAERAFLSAIALPPERNHAIPAELGPEEGARRYAEIVARALPFDLVLLGLGEDGHTASLFPGHVHRRDETVHAVRDAPKPPPERVSLGAATLADTRAQFVLVTGAGKREAVRAWRAGEGLPIATVAPATGTDVLIDEAAFGVE